MTDVFRRADPSEFGLLDAMTLAGVRHWGHHETHPDAYNGLVSELATDEEVDRATINVIDRDGDIVGFYDLRDRGDHVELVRMFQRPDLIGTGLGRRLWDHAVVEAGEIGNRMLILSDPAATGFYERMGARLEKRIEVEPGFSLGVFWYDLT